MQRRAVLGAFVAGLAGGLPVWAEAEQKYVKETRNLEHGWQVLSVAFSRNGRSMASGSADRTAKLWDARAGTLKRLLPEEC